MKEFSSISELSNVWLAMLSNVACGEIKVDRELYCIYIHLGCNGETNIYVYKKWPSIYEQNLKVALLEEDWTSRL